MDGNVGNLNLKFTADDNNFQQTATKIISTISSLQAKINQSLNKPMQQMANAQALANEKIARSQIKTATTIQTNLEKIKQAQNNTATNAQTNANKVQTSLQKLAQAQNNTATITKLNNNKIQKSQLGLNKSYDSISNQQKNLADVTQKTSGKISIGFKNIFSSIKNIAKFAIFSFLGRQLVNLGAKMFMLGSDMAEVENLFQVSFGNMSNQADAFANRLEKAWGVDPTPIKEQTAYLNQMFKSMQFGTQTSYTMSTELEKLSYNMSSLYNISQEDAFEKLRSGMAGQIRPLKSLGILIDDTTIKQYALDEGITTSTDSMTQQQKALARYYAILDQTKSSWASATKETKNGTVAIGDLSKTITNPQNQLRILQSRLSSIARYWGLAFIPIAQIVIPLLNSLAAILITIGKAFATFMAKLFGVGDSWKDIMGDWKSGGADFSGMEDFSDSADSAEKSMGGVAKNTDKTAKKMKELKRQLAGIDEINNLTTPSADTTSGTGGGGGGSGGAGKGMIKGLEWEIPKTPDPDPMIDELTKKIQKKLKDIFKPLKDSYDKYMPDIISNVKDAFDSIGRIGSSAMEIVGKNWKKWFGSFTNLFFSLLKTASTIFKTVANLLRWVWDSGGSHLYEQFGNLISSIMRFATVINDNIVNPFLEAFNSHMSPVIGKFIGGGLKKLGDIFETISNAIDSISTKIEELGKASQFDFSNMDTFSKALGGIGATLVGGGLIANFGNLVELVTRVTTFFPAVLNFINSLGGMSGIVTQVTTAFTTFFSGVAEGSGVITSLQAVLPNIGTSLMGLINPFTITATAIIGLVAGFTYLYTTSEKFRTEFNAILSQIFNNVKGIVDGIMGMVDTIVNKGIVPIATAIMNFVSELWNSGLASFIGEVSKLIANIINIGLSFVNNVLLPIGNLIMSIVVPAITTLVQGALNLIQPVLSVILSVGSKILEFINSVASFIAEKLFPIVKNIISIIQSGITIVWNILSPIINVITTVLGNLIGAILEPLGVIIGVIIDILGVLGDILSPIINWIGEFIGSIASMFEELANSDFVSFLSEQWTNVQESLSGVGEFFSGLWDGIVEKFNGVVSFFSDAWGNIAGFANTAWTLIKNIFLYVKNWFYTKVIYPVQTFFLDMWNKISGFAKSCWDNICSVFGTVKTWFTNHVITPVKNVFSGLWDGVKNLAQKGWDGITGIFKSIKSWFDKNVKEPIKKVFKNTWESVKNTVSGIWDKILGLFSKGGKIFKGVVGSIADVFKKIVNTIIGGINRVIRVPFDIINGLLNDIRTVEILGFKPFIDAWKKNPLPVPQIPKLATGGMAYEEMFAIIGDNPNASTDPEIVSPLSKLNDIMLSSFKQAMLETQNSNNLNGINQQNNNDDDRTVFATFVMDGRPFYQAMVKEDKREKRNTGRSPLGQR